MSERVFCVKSEHLTSILGIESHPDRMERPRSYFTGLDAVARLAALPAEAFCVGVRPNVESVDSLKQLATYAQVTAGDEVFVYQRAGDETRLHGNFSLGIGGHVGFPSGLDSFSIHNSPHIFMNYIWREAMREVSEELNINWIDVIGLFPTGIIYDPTNAVGRVHLGLSFRAAIGSRDKVTGRCASLRNSLFMPKREAMDRFPSFESWSQVMMQAPGS